MALAAVQATRLFSSTTDHVTGNIAATAGNLLVVCGVSYHGTDTTNSWVVTRTGDTYTTDSSASTVSGGNREVLGIASAPNCAGGTVSMTITSTGTSFGVEAYVLEISGAATSSPRDATSPAAKQGTSTTATTNSLTNVTPDAIFVSLIQTGSGANPATCTNTGTGFSDVAGGTTMQDLDGANDTVFDVAWKIVSSTAANNGAATTNNVLWNGLIAVYKMAAAAGGNPEPVVLAPFYHPPAWSTAWG